MTKLTVATTFGIFPARGGGQSRILGLYRALADRGVAVDVVALTAFRSAGGARRIAPGVREVRVPATEAYAAERARLAAAVGVPVDDVAVTLFHELAPAYGEALAESARDADAVVASHPYTFPALAELPVPVVYESHNVEADLKRTMYPDTEEGRELCARVADVERESCERAEVIVACTRADAERLGDLYGIDPAAVAVVPNGIDPEAIDWVAPGRRADLKASLGLSEVFQSVFIGSWHEPNLVAVSDILSAAEQLPEVRFLVVGSAGLAFDEDEFPPNADRCGTVHEGFLRSLLRIADVGLNPMRTGSGSNLKMLDYALAGLPVASTEVGARGLDLEPGVHYHRFAPDGLAAAIDAVRAGPPDVVAAREHVLERFSWDLNAERFLAHPHLRELLAGAVAAR